MVKMVAIGQPTETGWLRTFMITFTWELPCMTSALKGGPGNVDKVIELSMGGCLKIGFFCGRHTSKWRANKKVDDTHESGNFGCSNKTDKCADRRVGNLSRDGGYLGQDVRVSALEASEHLLHIIDNSGI